MADDLSVRLELLHRQYEAAQGRAVKMARLAERRRALLRSVWEVLFPAELASLIAAGLGDDEVGRRLYQLLLERRQGLLRPDDNGASQCEESRGEDKEEAAEEAPTVELTEEQRIVLQVLGIELAARQVLRRATERLGNSERTVHRLLSELKEMGLVERRSLAVPKGVGELSSTLYLLTEEGRKVYRGLFGAEPMSTETAFGGYHSPEAWWFISTVAQMIRRGNEAPNGRFVYEVFDPVAEPEATGTAGFRRRYGDEDGSRRGSEPDLIVQMQARQGGQALSVAVEVERALYAAHALKAKVAKNLRHYTGAGFAATYYVATTKEAAQLLRGAVRKVTADVREGKAVLPNRAFVAIFSLPEIAGVEAGWVPSPRMIETEWLHNGQPSKAWPQGAWPVFYYYKHKVKGGGRNGR